jgi:protein arginine N-methyltransferase 1
VFFVEEGQIIEAARQKINDAGFASRAEFFQANSFELKLPELVDVVVCDHVGCFGFDYGLLAILHDARQRFLKPGGITVPAQLDLMLAPVDSVACRKLVGRWRDNVPDDYRWLAATAANTKHLNDLTRDELLADATTLASLQLGSEAAAFMSWNAEFSCARDGTLDGVAGWFDCLLVDDVRMTNSPAVTERIERPPVFLPLESPVSVSAGEQIRVTVMARHQDHIIGWIVELPAQGKRYAHNTFNGLLLDREALTRACPDRPASLNDRGRAQQIVLSYCDGLRTVAEVQALVQREHPDLFPSARGFASFVTRVLSWNTGE